MHAVVILVHLFSLPYLWSRDFKILDFTILVHIRSLRDCDFGPFEQFEIDRNRTIEKIESQSLKVDQNHKIENIICIICLHVITSFVYSISYTVYDILFWTKKYTPSIYKWLKFFWTTQKSFWFTNRILLPCYQRISSLKRISEKFRIIPRVKHWMQFISLVVLNQSILLLNSKTISGTDWLI